MVNVIDDADALFKYDLEPNPSVYNETKENLWLVVNTFYHSKDGIMSPLIQQRADFALRFFKSAKEQGLNVVCSDGSWQNGELRESDSSWKAEAKKTGVHLVTSDRFSPACGDLGKNMRNSIQTALNLGAKLIAHTEAEKFNYLSSPSSPIILAATRVFDGSADIVIPRRKDNLASYNLLQRVNEFAGNTYIMEAIQSHLAKHGLCHKIKMPIETHQTIDSKAVAPYLDWFGGARIFNQDSAKYFLQYKGHLLTKKDSPIHLAGELHSTQYDKWHTVYIPVVHAILEGLNVRGVPVGYVHPAEQSNLEKLNDSIRKRRFDQLRSIYESIEDLLISHSQGLYPYSENLPQPNEVEVFDFRKIR